MRVQTGDRAVRSRLLPCVVFRASMQSAQHCTKHPSMSDYRDVATFGLCLHGHRPHFVQYSPLKVREVFTVRCREERIFCNPAACIRFIAPFNLCPGKTFPLTKMDLTKCRPHTAVDTKCLGNCPSSCLGPSQVARVNQSDVLR